MGSPCWGNSQEANAGRIQPSEQGRVAGGIRRGELPEKRQMWSFELLYFILNKVEIHSRSKLRENRTVENKVEHGATRSLKRNNNGLCKTFRSGLDQNASKTRQISDISP